MQRPPCDSHQNRTVQENQDFEISQFVPSPLSLRSDDAFATGLGDTSPVYRSICAEPRDIVAPLELLQPTSLTSLASTSQWGFDEPHRFDHESLAYIDPKSLASIDPKSPQLSLSPLCFDVESLPPLTRIESKSHGEPNAVTDGWAQLRNMLATDDFDSSLILSPAPSYLEPHTNFRVRGCTRVLVERVARLLRGVDGSDSHGDGSDRDLAAHFEFTPAQCAFDCVAYRRARAMRFRVCLWAAPEGDAETIVEFQRRSGDSMHFSELYQNAMRALTEVDQTHTPLGEAGKKDIPMLDATLEESIDITRATVVKNLNDMASSDFLEERSEGVHELAHLSGEAAHRPAILDAGALDTLMRALGADNGEAVRRCAATALANLCGVGASVSAHIRAGGGLEQLRLLLTGATSLEAVREAARALAAAAASGGNRDVTPPWTERDLSRVLDKLEQTQDQCAIDYRKHIQQSMSSSTTAVY